MISDDRGDVSASNISTEHQRDGDARRPSDTLDREQPTDPAPTNDDRETPGGNDQEPVEERENVGTVEPDDYPQQQ